VAAAIFWMKARAGWRERHEAQVPGPNGKPLAAPQMTVVNASRTASS
jgi:hypothetical protein